MKTTHALTTVTLLAALAGCALPRPQRGGVATTAPTPHGLSQTLSQGENPAQPSNQAQDSIKTRNYTIPPGSRIEDLLVKPSGTDLPLTNLHAVILSAPTPIIEHEETHARTELGASQKDMARELGAKLANLKSIVWVGLALFVFGLTSLVWPPLKTIIGSVTTSAMLTLGGLALIILPTLIVGNELLILGGVATLATAWFLAHRHGHLRGKLDSMSPNPPVHPSINPLIQESTFPPAHTTSPATRLP